MKRQFNCWLTILLLCITTVVASSQTKGRSSSTGSKPITDIHQIDFRNFTYQSSLCSREYGSKGIGSSVRVKDGEYKNKKVYFDITHKDIIFADLTGDGKDEAIVPIECGAIGANFSLSEFNIYTLENGHAALLAAINDKTLERDYRHYYHETESYWGINDSGLKVNNGNISIEVLVDGPHASPKYVATLEYRLKGKTLQLTGKPSRRPMANS